MSSLNLKYTDAYILVLLFVPLTWLPRFSSALIPELALIAMISYILIVVALELGNGRSKKTLTPEILTALCDGLGYIIIIYIMNLIHTCPEVLFNGYMHTSNFVVALKLLTVVTGRSILINSWRYVRGNYRSLLEYPVVISISLLFMLLLISATHLMTAFVAIIGFSLNLYVLIMFDSVRPSAREGGIKYFYLSAFSSGLMIYGIFLLFTSLGTGQFQEMNQALIANFGSLVLKEISIRFGILFLLIGIFFKLSAFPGHLWAAEIYEGSSDPVMAFFMVPVKVAMLAFTIQLLAVGLSSVASLWQPIVSLSAAGSLIWGCLGALGERKTKRFLAYASINQIGFLLMGIASGSFEGYRSTLLYLFLYALMNIGFLVVFLNARRFDDRSMLYLTDFRGLGQRHWLISWSVAVILFSMAGIPPLAGFFGKYYLLLHAQEQGLYGLVVIGLVTSLISTYYYLRIIKIFWFEGDVAMKYIRCKLDTNQQTVLFLIEGALWSFLVFSGPVMGYLTNLTCSLLLMPASYF